MKSGTQICGLFPHQNYKNRQHVTLTFCNSTKDALVETRTQQAKEKQTNHIKCTQQLGTTNNNANIQYKHKKQSPLEILFLKSDHYHVSDHGLDFDIM